MRFRRRIFALHLTLLVASTMYVLSYAPYVWWTVPNDSVTGNFYYRTSRVYRPVEWLTLQTEGWGSPLIAWAQLWGVRETANLQAWFYAHEIEEPTDISVNWR